MKKEFNTVGEYFYWIYANMSMAHAALNKGHTRYETIDYMIRSKLYKGLQTGTQHITSIYNDERDKLSNVCCSYCGVVDKLSLDHLIARSCGGSDSGENLVYACRHCNSSKGNKDLIVWCMANNQFPPILLLRRYLKLTYQYLLETDALNRPYAEVKDAIGCFRLDLLPMSFPEPEYLRI